VIRNRKVGPLLATMLVASNMVGSGIFLLPATLAGTGSITVIGWLIATAGALLVAAVLARLGRISPQAGGPCAYAAEAFGPYMGFQTTAIYWISCWCGNIAIAVTATSYLASFVPVLALPVPGALATVGLIWLLTVVNVLGPRLVCQVESVAIVLGLIPILLIATAGWWYFDPALFKASWNIRHEPVMTAVPHSLVLVFWAFTGLESASVAAAVVEDPDRNVPVATIGGVLVAAAVYVTSCSVMMGLIPAPTLAASTAPFADAARLVLGTTAGAFVAVMALVKTVGTLGGWILITAQTGKAGADRGLFPAVFGRADRHGTPVPALLLMAAVMSILVLATMSPRIGEQFGKLIEVSTLFCLLAYVYSCIALWRLDRPGRGPRTWALVRYRMLAVAAALACVWVILESEGTLLVLSAATVALTVPLYWLFIRPLWRVSHGVTRLE
jgi:arginine:agmatine antiporter